MKQDNRGMTLVELIIAVTVSVIIMGAATMFIRNALKSYETASNTIDLQMESQVLMEQLATWIMEGNRVVVDGNTLIIYEIPREVPEDRIPDGVMPPDTNATKRVIWQQDNKLYMVVRSGITNPDEDTTIINASEARVENCIGEYVSAFLPSVDASNQYKVTIQLKLAEGSQEYELKNEIKVRNELMQEKIPFFAAIGIGGSKDEEA